MKKLQAVGNFFLDHKCNVVSRCVHRNDHFKTD